MQSFFKTEIKDHIAHIAFNRPEKANALNAEAWQEMKTLFTDMSENPAVRVIILSGEGKHWSAGIDLELLMSLAQLQSMECEGRKREQVRNFIVQLQACINAIEDCCKPVVAAIHNGCIGGALDIATACDMRYCTEEAYFTIKEVDLGLVADIGTLQRLPKIIPAGQVHEMAYTGRKVYGPEAVRMGLVNQAFANKEAMLEAVQGIAQTIAAKSPLVIRGIKKVIRHTRDHSVQEGLDYVADYNAAHLLSNDLFEAFEANMARRKPVFKD